MIADYPMEYLVRVIKSYYNQEFFEVVNYTKIYHFPLKILGHGTILNPGTVCIEVVC